MSTNIMLDTNILLSAVLPNNVWKKSIDSFLNDLKQLQSNPSKVVVHTMDIIRYEINQIIREVSEFVIEEFRIIAMDYLHDNKPFDKKSVKRLHQKVNNRLKAQTDRHKKISNRNLITHFENYLLKQINENPNTSKKDILLNVFSVINKFDIRLRNSIEQILIDYQINKLVFPRNRSEKQKVLEIKRKIPMKNDSDKKILSFFEYHLEKTQSEGLFITYDFGDFHKNAKEIHEEFQLLTILRPNYLSCYCSY